MQGSSQDETYPKQARNEMALGRCLVEGDPRVASSARRARRKTFGVSLAIELLLVGSLVVTPLLTGVAEPQLRQILPTQLTFSGA